VEKGQGSSEDHMYNSPLRTEQKPIPVHIFRHIDDVAAGLNARQSVLLKMFLCAVAPARRSGQIVKKRTV
jgi:hypothetical protein